MQFRLLATIILLSIVSCKTYRNVGVPVEAPNVSYSKFVNQYSEKSFSNSETKTVKIDAKMSYQIGNSSHKLGMKIRIAKGEKIWISGDFLGIPVVKMLLEQNKVFYYNKIDHTYFEGSYELIEKVAGVNVTYTMIEKMLLGDIILDLNSKHFNLSENQDEYYIRDIDDAFLTEVIIYPLVFRTKSQVIEEIIGANSFGAYYNQYQKIDSILFPKELSMKVNDRSKGDGAVVTLKYTKIKLNEELKFPYSVPKECNKKVQLKSSVTKSTNE